MRGCTALTTRVTAFVSALVCISVGAAAGELSDSVIFGTSRSQRSNGVRGSGHKETLAGRVGTVDEKISCWTSGAKLDDSLELTLQKRPGQTARLQVQEAYPPEAPGTRYTYRVYANSKLVYIRDYPALMFSRVSYFVELDDPALVKASKVAVRFANSRKDSPFRICAVWLYSDFATYCKSAGFGAPFHLAPLMGDKSGDELDKEFLYLKNNIQPRPDTDIKLGCASEHHYMNRDAAATRTQLQQLLACAKKYDMPLELAFVSWWSGTPMWFPDGKGGKFSDPEYQQVCWSETDNYDEGEALKKLLGSKWDLRYGWTVPNRWSSTPWLTMNSDRLNAARHKTIGEHLDILSEILRDPANKGTDKYLLALEMENEPRYWDLHCPDEKYPVKRENLWADFNPVTVAAAARDGIKLDPKDGLDYKERLWLHENVARYQQGTFNAHARALKHLRVPFINSPADSFWHEVYSHGFPQPVFPMEQVTSYHPGLEWNRLNGCRTGLEDVAVPAAAYLEVAREWGRWAQINYEENNGKGTEWHLRALRSCYTYGARFYTFYNWQSINKEGGWLRYVQQFCKDEPKTQVTERGIDTRASFIKAARHEFAVDVPNDWSTLNEVWLNLDTDGEYVLSVYDNENKDHLLGYRCKTPEHAMLVAFDLPNCVSIDDHKRVYFVLTRTDGAPFGMMKYPDGKPVVTLYTDTARERAQSLMICWRADAQSLITELRDRGASGLRRAEELFRAGDYRRAYDEAARLEAKRSQ